MAKLVSLDVVNFQQEIQRIEREVLDLVDAEVDDLIDYATEQLIIVTPVDTGEAREGWKNDKGKEFKVIINDVEHIVYLNNGHSQQAPAYFIEEVLTKIGILTPN